MSTRGCVGVYTGGKDPDGRRAWRGVYNHSDSYPTGLGEAVFNHLKCKSANERKEFAKEILSFSDWREYINGGVCEYCGQKGVGQPHTISGQIACHTMHDRDELIKRRARELVNNPKAFDSMVKEIKAIDAIKKNVAKTGYPDPKAKYHEHDKEPATIFSQNAEEDALFIEWAYIADIEADELDVYVSARSDGKHTNTGANGNTWESSNYQYILVTSLSLAGVVSWDDVEAMGRAAREAAYEKYGDRQMRDGVFASGAII